MTGKAVDLGLSVLWADINIGASEIFAYGKLFGYGDTNGENYSEEKNMYPRTNIVNSPYDTAKAMWGNGWRMPTCDELKELSAKCQFTPFEKNGIKGTLVTGPNGNSIFLPFDGVRIGINTHRTGQLGQYWSGTLSNNYHVSMDVFGYDANLSLVSPSWGRSIRPVRDK